MFCIHCGKEIADGSKFCPYCGQSTELEGTQSEAGSGSTDAAGAAGQETAAVSKVAAGKQKKPAGPRKPVNKKALGGVVVAAAAVIVVAAVAANHRTALNLNDFVQVTFDGYETVGKAEATIDEEAMREKCSNLKVNDKGLKELAKEEGMTDDDLSFVGNDLDTLISFMGYNKDDPAEFLYDEIEGTGSLDREEALSNGDTVTYSFNIDEDKKKALEDTFKVKLLYDDQEFTVDGLKEVKTYDPFQDLTVTFDGVAPNGQIEIQNNSSDSFSSHIDYTATQSSGLSNGDTVTVNAYAGDDDQTAEEYGIIISPKSKDYTVEGLGSYITSAADLPEDMLSKMQDEAKDQMDAMVASDWADSAELKSFTYIGNYILSKKSPDLYGSENEIYLIYKVQAHVHDEDDNEVCDKDVNYYIWYSYSDVYVTPDGESDIDYSRVDSPWDSFTVEDTASWGWFGYNTWTFKGYEDLDTLYKTVVTAQKDTYKVEENVKDIETKSETASTEETADAASSAETADAEASTETADAEEPAEASTEAAETSEEASRE